MKTREPIRLIINADDYGYFPCVSQGILEAARTGNLTATGVLANSTTLIDQLVWLDSVKNLAVGVHLNLTFGRPMTTRMAEKLCPWQGHFPSAYVMSLMILRGKISIDDVRREWCAQIEACYQGRQLAFLNSHEHIHMLPALFPLVLELAQAYQISHVRITQADWLSCRLSALFRNTAIQAMRTLNQLKYKAQAPPFLGLSCSGKLSYRYLDAVFSKLTPGIRYELMCHPGHFDPNEITDVKLQSYHDWEGELLLLQSPKTHSLYEKYGIRLDYYQH